MARGRGVVSMTLGRGLPELGGSEVHPVKGEQCSIGASLCPGELGGGVQSPAAGKVGSGALGVPSSLARGGECATCVPSLASLVELRGGDGLPGQLWWPMVRSGFRGRVL